jgi:hypothetical protein
MTKQFDNFADLITFTRASTGTYLDSDGLLKTATTNTPRVEYDINGNRKGLLIEEARTNLNSASEALTVSPWSATNPNTTLTANDKIAPDGNLTGTKVVATGSTNTGITRVINTGSTIASKSFTLSVWVYADATFNFDLRVRGNGSVQEAQNITVSTVAGEWVRVHATASFTASADGNDLLVAYYTGIFGVANTNTLWFWGAQVETASFPTSYIPTAGAAATRAADVASIPTSAFGYNQKAGTVVVEAETQFGTPTGFPRIWEIGNGGFVDRVYGFINVANSQIRCGVLANGVTAADFSVKTDPTPASGKLAFAFADDDFSGVIDGGSPVTDTSGSFTTPSTPRNTLKIGGAGNSSSANMSGHIKSLSYFPRRLTNAQLQRLTE